MAEPIRGDKMQKCLDQKIRKCLGNSEAPQEGRVPGTSGEDWRESPGTRQRGRKEPVEGDSCQSARCVNGELICHGSLQGSGLGGRGSDAGRKEVA